MTGFGLTFEETDILLEQAGQKMVAQERQGGSAFLPYARMKGG